MENFYGRSFAGAFRVSNALFHTAKLQQPDPVWSVQAAEEIERVLVETGIYEHANNWTIDCRSTVCTVLFDTAIADYNEDEATDLLTECSFGRAIWRRCYRENTSYLMLTRPGYYFEM